MGQNAIYYKGKSYSGGGGGGTEVIPNPQGEPTDTLETISIDGTVYDIESSGSDGASYGYSDPNTNFGVDKDIYIKYIGDNVISEWKTAGTFNNPTQHAAYDLKDSFGRDISNDYSISMTYTAGSQSITWEILVANITTSWTKMEGDWNTGYSGIRINPSTNRYEFHTDYMSTHTLKYKTNNFTPITMDSIWHKTNETWHKDNSSKVIANPEDAATDTLTKLSVNGDVYGIKSYQEITKAEYDALPASKLTDDILYCITDGGATEPGKYFNPVIYSTTEREIGVWTDGKPLYQKTINCGALPNNTDKRVQHGIQNVDYFVGMFGIAENPNINSIPIIFSNSGGSGIATVILEKSSDIIIRCNSDRSTYTRTYITLQYTKTTDTPGSGKYTTLGVPSIHYSTDEQVIGTWIDGKPLYQKTVEVTNITRSAWNSYLVDANAVIRNIEGWYGDASNNLPLNYFAGSVIMNRQSDGNNGYFSLYGSGTISTATVTVKYTKITD